MKSKGQFILFTVDEFDDFLRSRQFSREVRFIQNHHTLIPRYSDFNGSNHFARLAAMKKHHVEANGWADIGQTLTTFPDGTVAVCRPFEKTPACIFGNNKHAVCIEHLGNFDVGRDKMTPEHREAIIRVNALLCREFKLPVNTSAIVYHHWFDLDTGKRNNGTKNNKSCPGTNFFGGNKVGDCEANFLPLVAAELNRLTGGGGSVAVFKVVSDDGVLTVRDAPRPSGVELGKLVSGSTVQVFEASGKWRRIDQEQQRWVHGGFLVPA